MITLTVPERHTVRARKEGVTPMSYGWRVKQFKTREAMIAFRERNGHRFQMVEVFINNGYALDIRPLRRIG